MHYHPTSDDLFRIITQISRFLREFSDFETYYTPDFRHPKLIGNKKELEDIGIVESQKVGRETLYINKELIEILKQ